MRGLLERTSFNLDWEFKGSLLKDIVAVIKQEHSSPRFHESPVFIQKGSFTISNVKGDLGSSIYTFQQPCLHTGT
jgi:hypothetical protein